MLINLLAGQNFREKVVPCSSCVPAVLSIKPVSLLIKMNGHLMARVVSFNVTFVFIFHPNIPLSEDSRVYKPSLQSSRVTITTQLYSFSHFPLLPLFISLYLPVFCSPPFLSYSVYFALLLSPKTDWRYRIESRLCYLRVIFYSPTVAFASAEHTLGYIS